MDTIKFIVIIVSIIIGLAIIIRFGGNIRDLILSFGETIINFMRNSFNGI